MILMIICYLGPCVTARALGDEGLGGNILKATVRVSNLNIPHAL